MRKFYENNKQLIKGAILIIALFVILFSTNLIKFGWQNDQSEADLKQMKNEINLLNTKLSTESNIRKVNSTKIKQFENSIKYLDASILQKDKEIQDLNVKYDKKIKNIDNLSASGLSEYFSNRYK